MKAQCQCGQLSADVPARARIVVACHCLDCQRRSGSPFGVFAYYFTNEVTTTGEAKRFVRPTAGGNTFETFFCPACGSTVYAKPSKKPSLIGVAVGAIADPSFRAPHVSVWEQSRHAWVAMPADMQHFMQNDRA